MPQMRHKAHRRRKRMVQLYSQSGGNVSFLTNTIELVLLSAYPSPQPKRQIDRLSGFCTAQGRKCLYFTMDAPIANSYQGLWTPCPLTQSNR